MEHHSSSGSATKCECQYLRPPVPALQQACGCVNMTPAAASGLLQEVLFICCRCFAPWAFMGVIH